jgi:hypothetical protein
MGFLAIPDEARCIARRGGAVRNAVFYLYDQADLARWQSFRFTDREIAAETGLSRRGVWDLLDELERAGLASVTRSTTRAPSTLELFRSARSEPELSQNRARTEPELSQNNRPATLATCGPEPELSQNRARTEPELSHRARRSTRAPDPRPQTPDRGKDPPQPPRAGGADSEPPVIDPGTSARREWVTQTAMPMLDECAADGTIGQVLDQHRTGETGLVDRWMKALGGDRKQTLNGPVTARHPGFESAPEGIRRRDVVAGLRQAAERWRAPATGPPDPKPEDLPSSNLFHLPEASARA